ncbi:MAG: hypothetical protein HC767_10625 [Akkermansiaceae bacterium]|nr:hypothetical protein [Akkermansiaceae bacterium]
MKDSCPAGRLAGKGGPQPRELMYRRSRLPEDAEPHSALDLLESSSGQPRKNASSHLSKSEEAAFSLQPPSNTTSPETTSQGKSAATKAASTGPTPDGVAQQPPPPPVCKHLMSRSLGVSCFCNTFCVLLRLQNNT